MERIEQAISLYTLYGPKVRQPLCVGSDSSKSLKPDIPAGLADSHFRKSPQSAKAEILTHENYLLNKKIRGIGLGCAQGL